MKICVGLKSYEDLEGYISAGAKEFYCGVIDEKWYSQYHFISGLNRRAWPTANFSSFAELKKVVKKAHQEGCQVFYTMNEHCYTNDQLEVLDYYYDRAVDTGVDAIIFADPGLMQYFKDRKVCDFHISTGGTVFNRWSVQFYQELLDVDRIIFPRHLTLDEIGHIREHCQDVETEVFILNEGCINIDGYCNHLHGVRYVSRTGDNLQQQLSTTCQLDFQVTQITGQKSSRFTQEEFKEKLKWARLNKGNCGICGLYFLKDKGIDSLKLVGRASGSGKIEADIRFLNHSIELLRQANSFQEFYQEISSQKCKQNTRKDVSSCYYPDILKELKNV